MFCFKFQFLVCHPLRYCSCCFHTAGCLCCWCRCCQHLRMQATRVSGLLDVRSCRALDLELLTALQLVWGLAPPSKPSMKHKARRATTLQLQPVGTTTRSS